jgi:hypothetical protein
MMRTGLLLMNFARTASGAPRNVTPRSDRFAA